MLPSTFVGLLLFLWLITPGFVFNTLAARRRTLETETTLQEASRIILASVLFSTMAGVILVVLNAWVVGPARGVDLDLLINSGAVYVRHKPVALAIYLAFQVLLACGLAWVGDWWIRRAITKRTGKPPPRLHVQSAWTRPLAIQPQDAEAHAWVRMKSGVEFTGKLDGIGHEIDLTDRELVLISPLLMRTPGGQTQKLLWQWLIVQGPDIDSLAVRYEPTSSSA